MKGHPDKNEIFDYILSGDKDEGSTGRHISSCSSCRKSYLEFSRIFQPSVHIGISPPDYLEERILNTIESGRGDSGEIAGSRRVMGLKPLLAAAAVLVIAILSAVVITVTNRNSTALSLNNIRGDVSIDNRIITHNTDVHELNTIITGEESKVDINYKDLFAINIGCNTVLKIEKIESSISSGKSNFVFNLEKGIVYSKFKHDKENNRFSFITPNSEIYSIGTKFILTADNKSTVLLLTEGSVKLKPTKPVNNNIAGNEMTVSQNFKYVITDTIESHQISEDEKKLVKMVEDRLGSEGEKALNAEEFSANMTDGKKCSELQSNIVQGDDAKGKRYESGEERNNKKELRDETGDMRRELKSDVNRLKRSMKNREMRRGQGNGTGGNGNNGRK